MYRKFLFFSLSEFICQDKGYFITHLFGKVVFVILDDFSNIRALRYSVLYHDGGYIFFSSLQSLKQELKS